MTDKNYKEYGNKNQKKQLRFLHVIIKNIDKANKIFENNPNNNNK